MANRKVAVYKQVKVNSVWVKCPPYINPTNKKPENDKVLVGGKMEIHPEGDWGIFYYEGSKRIWKKVGAKYAEAKRAADVKELALRGRAKGLVVVEPDDKRRLQAAVDVFLDDIKNSRSLKTYQLYKYDLQEFVDWVKKDFVEDLTRADLLRFHKHIQATPELARGVNPHTSKKLRSERTAANKVAEVNQFYRSYMKLDPGKGLVTMKDIKFEESDVDVYSEAELTAFFSACKPTEHLLFSMFLQTGLRKQEMENLQWNSINFETRRLTIKGNAEREFKTKTRKARSISLHSELLERLKAHQLAATNPTGPKDLVFPTRSGKKNDKFWDLCRTIAKRAKLDPERFFVHKFRATFATTCLQKGMDLATVQKNLGHTGSDMSSTARYLAAAKADQQEASMEAVWGKPQSATLPGIYDEFLGGK